MSTVGWILLFTAIICTVFASILSAAEQAFNALSNARAQDLVEDDLRGAKKVAELVKHQHRTLEICEVLLIANHVLVAASVLLLLLRLHLPWYLALVFSLLISLFILLFLEILLARPIGRFYPETTALILAPTVTFLQQLLTPFRFLIRTLYRFGLQSPLTDAQVRAEMVDDLKEMVDEFGEEENLELEQEDREILRSVFEMGVTIVREIVVPRTEMVTVDLTTSTSDALGVFIRSGFSRIPVIGEDSDDIRGVLYLKDVVGKLYSRPDTADRPVHNLMREAHFVPETMYADDLLRDMQDDAPHLALVVDEWGGIVGLVTFEDLLEELVGDVTDEHDHAEQEPEQLAEYRWKVPARLPIDELGELFGIELEDEDVDTTGGLLTKALGKVPIAGDSAEVMGMRLEVESVSGRRKQMAWLYAELLEKPQEKTLE